MSTKDKNRSEEISSIEVALEAMEAMAEINDYPKRGVYFFTGARRVEIRCEEWDYSVNALTTLPTFEGWSRRVISRGVVPRVVYTRQRGKDAGEERREKASVLAPA